MTKHDLLFLVAQDFLKLNTRQQLAIGVKFKLVDINAYFWSPETVEQTIFRLCYINKKLPELVREMHKELHEQGT